MQTVYDIFPNIGAIRNPEAFPDIKDDTFWAIYKKCEPYSMIGIDAFYNIFKSVEYISKNKIPGDFVECGVYLGGAAMAAAEFLNHFEGCYRKIYLYDTFEGFPENTSSVDLHGKVVHFNQHANFQKNVEQNLANCDYDFDLFEVIPGFVEKTLAVEANLPRETAFLRLDTDYYESTKVELERLYPRLTKGGLCTIDDYGKFDGARQATDEYLSGLATAPMPFRVNFSVRVFLKST